MGSPHSYSSLQLYAMRVAKLAASGAPLTGANNGYATNILISAELGIELEEGEEFLQKRGDGAFCGNFRDCDRVKRSALTLELCELDLELIGFLCGGTVVRDLAGAGVGNATGWKAALVDDPCPNGVCVEFWTKAMDVDIQATPPFLGTTTAYWHFTLPRCYFNIGSITLENDFATIPVEGWGLANERITSNGPFDDWGADVSAAGGWTSAFNVDLYPALPAISTSRITVSSAAS